MNMTEKAVKCITKQNSPMHTSPVSNLEMFSSKIADYDKALKCILEVMCLGNKKITSIYL